jgi:predicted choloylglycine hydrolase
MRYLLEVVASTVEEACAILKRVPRTSYSVNVLDISGHWATVFVGPDDATYVSRWRAITNFQHKVDWPEHAKATSAVERLAVLEHLFGT